MGSLGYIVRLLPLNIETKSYTLLTNKSFSTSKCRKWNILENKD